MLYNRVLFIFTLLLLVMSVILKTFNFLISVFVLFQTWLILTTIELSDKWRILIRPELHYLLQSV